MLAVTPRLPSPKLVGSSAGLTKTTSSNSGWHQRDAFGHGPMDY